MLKFALKKRLMARQSAMLITGTGRSGTTFLANVLNSTYPEISVGHEVEPTGIGIQNLSAREQRKTLIQGRGRFALRNALTSKDKPALIESNCFLAPAIDAYLDVWAECKVVGGIRSWETCVESMASQTFSDSPNFFYSGHDHQGPRRPNPVALGETPAARWQGFSRLEKIAWYWSYVNKQLIEAAKRHPDRVMLISFEEMRNDPDETVIIIEKFFGLPLRDPIVNVRTNSSKERKQRRFDIAECSKSEIVSMEYIVRDTEKSVADYFGQRNRAV